MDEEPVPCERLHLHYYLIFSFDGAQYGVFQQILSWRKGLWHNSRICVATMSLNVFKIETSVFVNNHMVIVWLFRALYAALF